MRSKSKFTTKKLNMIDRKLNSINCDFAEQYSYFTPTTRLDFAG